MERNRSVAERCASVCRSASISAESISANESDRLFQMQRESTLEVFYRTFFSIIDYLEIIKKRKEKERSSENLPVKKP